MPHYCCVPGCNNIGIGGFYLFPPPRTRTSCLQKLAEIRRERWFKAINEETLNTKTARVCSRHFISGKSAGIKDCMNPDWVPSLNMGYGKNFNPLHAKTRFQSQTKNAQNKILRASQVNFPELIETKRKCANLLDYFSPDWVPTLHLGKSKRALARKGKSSNLTPPIKPSHSLSSADGVMEVEKCFDEEYLDETAHNSEDTESASSDDDDDDDVMEIEKPLEEEYLDENSLDTEIATERSNKPRVRAINCCVPNCKNVRCKQESRIKFFRFPSVEQNINGKIYRSERLSAWINAIKRIDITHLNAPYKMICSDHFNTGAPAKSNDKSHPDWIPNQKLPTTLTKAVKKTSTANKICNLEPWDSSNAFDPLAEEEIQMQVDVSEIKTHPEIENMEKEIQQLKLENEMLKKQLMDKDAIIADQNKELLKLIECHKFELQDKDTVIQMLETTNLKISLSRDGFKNDDKKVNYFTGLPSFAVLDIIFNFIQDDLVACLMRRINKFDAFILVLMKLRLDLPLAYLGYRYGIAGNTAATIFHTNLKMLSEKIGPFIRWPEKTALRENTSVYFKRVLGNKFTALIDFIEDPGPNVSQEYIIQKKYIKHKYLIAISPAGAIIFVSKGYDSSLSVKEIAESCGVLDYTDDGDIILSDHGTVSHQVYSYNGSKVLIQSTNQDENDLLDSLLQNPTQLSTENPPEEGDNCRVYIQRSISNLKNKFFVLNNKQKIAISKSYKNNEGECYFDYVVRVCCALINVSPAILSLETKKS